MRICVFGAGAVGVHLAVHLADTDADVSVLARGTTLEAIRARGLELRGPDGVRHARVRASADAAALGAHDVVLVTTKATALPAAAPAIAALLGPTGLAVFLQNGIPWWYFHGHGGPDEGRRLPALDPGGVLWDSVGPQRAAGGVTSTPCTVVAPGVVDARGGNRPMALGAPDGSVPLRLAQLADLLRRAGVPVDLAPRIREAIWAKLALNLGSGPLAMLAPVPLSALFAQDACVEARMRILDEVEATAAAMGCPIRASRAMDFVRASPHVPSIGQDVAAGRKPELEAMVLAPLAMARTRGVATPVLDLLAALCKLKLQAQGLYP